MTEEEWIQLQCELAVNAIAYRGDLEIQAEISPPEKQEFVDMPLKDKKIQEK